MGTIRNGSCFLFILVLFLAIALIPRTIFIDSVQYTSSANFASSNTNPYAVQWNRTYGGAGDEVAFSVVQRSDGGYALAGHTDSFGGGHDDFWLVQTDAAGRTIWSRTYGGAGYEGAFFMIQTSDYGYALAGDIHGPGSLGCDFWLVKTDPDGNVLFNRTFGGPGDEGALSIIQVADGGYVLAGDTKPAGANMWDLWLVRTDAEGNILWNRTYGGIGDDAAFSVVETADGGYAVAGHTSSFGSGEYDFWLIKTDPSGLMQWNKTYGGKEDDEAFCVTQSNDGYTLAGNTKSSGAGGYDFWLIRTDAAGNLLWNKTYGGAGDEGAFSMVQTRDSYLLVGDTDSFGAGRYDFWLIKTDLNGKMIWNETYGGPNDDIAFSVTQINDEGYALAGDTKPNGTSSWDFCLIKLTPEAKPPILLVRLGNEAILTVLISATIVALIVCIISRRRSF